ncbi:hypothetical protein AAFF_G00387210 [Aldrovandia affinis]|uniref:Uncharacterized protein n=1 Tax=Aldrovandia affinis TaxID=143900 RepID=A0AAD7SEJ6_9TELE|nr:hypothetical protein AAFF_G00387210 [Aldrovandia affinis]
MLARFQRKTQCNRKKRLVLELPCCFSFSLSFCNLLSTADPPLNWKIHNSVRSAQHDSTLEMHAVISVRSRTGCVDHAVMLGLHEGAGKKHYIHGLGRCL